MQYELYRKTTLGVSLTDSLEELLQNSKISPELAAKVLLQFDKSINHALTNQVKTKASFKGHLHTFRFCDGVWTFILENTAFRTETETIHVNVVKIVACDGKTEQKGGKKKD
eukprot:TRINITY_DN76_c0_g1_i1.p1 TRINITY_DN76_c0_g1~~TRINITY_DN76_c0_g1_i1.p1  ORF type:complete len:112 (-),score=17.55 TRINITY_DN76_c0_g1_i1:45-380(-)